MKTHPHSLRAVTALALTATIAACSAPATPQPPTAQPQTPLPTAPRPTAVPVKPPTDAELAKLADDYLSTLAQQDKFGGAVLIARDGAPIFSKAYGYADRANKKPIDADTQFFVPKAAAWPELAAVALKMQAEGKLKLDDSVCTHLSNCLDHYKPITMRHLLSNTGGVPDGRYDDVVKNAVGAAGPSGYTSLPADKFAAPGRAFATAALPNGVRVPADLGNYLLTLISEVIRDGQSDAISFFNRRISDPLGIAFGLSHQMNDSNRTRLYDQIGSREFVEKDYTGYGVMTLAHLNTLVQALFNGKLISSEQLAEMVKPVAKVDGLPGDVSYGLGVYTGKDPNGRAVVFQQDLSEPGYGAYWAQYPDDKLTIVVLNNLTDWTNQPHRARDIGLELATKAFTPK